MNASFSPPVHALSLTGGSASSGSMLLNLSGAMLLVLVAIIVTALWLRRSRVGGSLTRRNSLLNVRQIHALGQREQVVIVEVSGRWLLLGVTAGSITLLTELDKNDAETETTPDAAAGSFQQLLCQLIKKPESSS